MLMVDKPKAYFKDLKIGSSSLIPGLNTNEGIRYEMKWVNM